MNAKWDATLSKNAHNNANNYGVNTNGHTIAIMIKCTDGMDMTEWYVTYLGDDVEEHERDHWLQPWNTN